MRLIFGVLPGPQRVLKVDGAAIGPACFKMCGQCRQVVCIHHSIGIQRGNDPPGIVHGIEPSYCLIHQDFSRQSDSRLFFSETVVQPHMKGKGRVGVGSNPGPGGRKGGQVQGQHLLWCI